MLCFDFQLKFYILFVVVLHLMIFSLFVILAVYSLLLCVGFTADVFQSICYLGCLQSVVLYWFYSLHLTVY